MYFDHNNETRWSKACFEENFKQFVLDVEKEKFSYPSISVPKFEENAEYCRIEGEDFTYLFNKFYGFFESMNYKGTELLDSKMSMGFWRAVTDNEIRIRKAWMDFTRAYNESLGLMLVKPDCRKCIIKEKKDYLEITVNLTLAAVSKEPLMKCEVVYKVYGDGHIETALEGNIHPEAIELPRFGFEITMPKGNEAFSYYGMGPYDSYVDMHTLARYGWFGNYGVR